jgi:hypothetical protein
MFNFNVVGLVSAIQAHTVALRAQTAESSLSATKQLAAQQRAAAALEGILFLMQRAARPARPTGLHAIFVEERMADQLVYKVVVDPVADPDVVKRELTIIADGDLLSTREVGLSDTDLGEIMVPQDAKIVLKVVDYDDAQPSPLTSELTAEFDALDQQSPATPSGLSIQFVREEAEVATPPEEPAPEVPVEPEVPAEPAPETPPE